MNDMQSIGALASTIGLPGVLVLMALTMLRDRSRARRNSGTGGKDLPCVKNETRLTRLETAIPLQMEQMRGAVETLRADLTKQIADVRADIRNLKGTT